MSADRLTTEPEERTMTAIWQPPEGEPRLITAISVSMGVQETSSAAMFEPGTISLSRSGLRVTP
jgi:hypothetical protein